MRAIGCHGNRKAIQRYREALATGFQVGLLLCPTTEKGFSVEIARDSLQVVDFSGGEEASRDFGVITWGPDIFEINADVAASGDSDEGKTG